MTLKNKYKTSKGLTLMTTFLFSLAVIFFSQPQLNCNIYKFNSAVIPDSIKTVKINFILNKARYINPQLSQRLTEKLRQKFNGQTRLTQTNNDNPDWEISGFISDYTFSTSIISDKKIAGNKLTVGVHITFNKHKDDKVNEYDISRSFEFEGNQSFQQAEAALSDEMTRTLTDEIFNRLFDQW